MSTKGKLMRLLGSVLLRSARVLAAEDAGPGFRRVVLDASGLPRLNPGDRLQLLLPSDDVRTYTPFASGGVEAMELLGYRQPAGGPGARWLAVVKEGDEVPFAGPQRSLSLPSGPVVLVGDETSVGVAASFDRARPGKVEVIFQAGSPDDLRAAAEVVGLRPKHVAERGEVESMVEAALAARAATPEATLALTGGSELVIAMRSALRGRGVRDAKVKTYWIPGKVGLD